MPPSLLTPLNLQKLIKLQHALLTARPTLAPLMKHRLSGMMNAVLSIARRRRALVGSIAASPPTGRVGRDVEAIVVRELGLVLGGRGGGRVRGRGKRGRMDGLDAAFGHRRGHRRRGGFFGGRRLRGLRGWGVVDGGVFGCRAGRDGEEFFEGQDAGFAAFPAWRLLVGGGMGGRTNVMRDME